MDADNISLNIFKNRYFIAAIIIFLLQIVIQNFLNPLPKLIFIFIAAPTVLVLIIMSIFSEIKKAKELPLD